MYKEMFTPKVIDAIRVLTGIKEKAQVNLAELGFTYARLVTLRQDLSTQVHWSQTL